MVNDFLLSDEEQNKHKDFTKVLFYLAERDGFEIPSGSGNSLTFRAGGHGDVKQFNYD